MPLVDGAAATVSLCMIEQPHTKQSDGENQHSAQGSKSVFLSLRSAVGHTLDSERLSTFTSLATRAVLGNIRMTDAERQYLESLISVDTRVSNSVQGSSKTIPFERKQVTGVDHREVSAQALETAMWCDFESFLQHMFGCNQMSHNSEEDSKYPYIPSS